MQLNKKYSKDEFSKTQESVGTREMEGLKDQLISAENQIARLENKLEQLLGKLSITEEEWFQTIDNFKSAIYSCAKTSWNT